MVRASIAAEIREVETISPVPHLQLRKVLLQPAGDSSTCTLTCVYKTAWLYINTDTPLQLAVPQGVFDVAISATKEDGALAEFIKGEIMAGHENWGCGQ